MFCLLLNDCCFLSNNYPILGFHHLLSLPAEAGPLFSEGYLYLFWITTVFVVGFFLCGKKLSTAGCQILLPVFYLTSTFQGRPWLRLGIKLQSFWVLRLSIKFTEALGWETVMPWLSFKDLACTCYDVKHQTPLLSLLIWELFLPRASNVSIAALFSGSTVRVFSVPGVDTDELDSNVDDWEEETVEFFINEEIITLAEPE